MKEKKIASAFRTEKSDAGLRVYLKGEIDHHNAKDLRSSLDALLETEKPMNVVLDMASVTFMDSSGLGLVLGRMVKAEERGGKLSLSRPSKCVQRMIELSGLGRKVHIEQEKER